MKPCGRLRSSARRSTERGIRKTTSLTRTPPDRVAQTSGPAISICHEIGVPSAEADDTTIDMKPQQEPSTQEVLAGLVERRRLASSRINRAFTTLGVFLC
jgi:hypothetical protein